MDPNDNPPEQLHRPSEDKLSKPRLRGQLLLPDRLHAGSLQTDSSPSRFGGMRLGIEESVVGLLIYFPLLVLLRWVFDRRDHSASTPPGDKANKLPGDFIAVKYATTTTRQDVRSASGSRAKCKEEAMVLSSSSDPGGDHDIEAGASAPSSPRPRAHVPPLSVDEVLQKSVWGFREKWWPTSSTAAFEAARIEEAEGNVGGIGGFDMHPETKAFLDKYVYSRPLCISISISRTCPAVEENICYVPSPTAAEAVSSLPCSTSTSPPSISSAHLAVKEHTRLILLPSVANAVGASCSSAAEETTGRARADTTENDVAGSMLAGSELGLAFVSSAPVVVGPNLFEALSIGGEEPDMSFPRVESSLSISQGVVGKEAISLDLPDGVTRGELETNESGYDGDDDDDDNDNDCRPGRLSIGGVMVGSREQQQVKETEKMTEEEHEEEDIKTTSLADGAIVGKLRTIGSDDDNDDNDVRYLGSNRFAVLFESSDGEEEQEDDMESFNLADREMEEKLTTIGCGDGNDGNDAIDAPHVSNNRFAVLFESSEEEDEEEKAERQEEEEKWAEKWGEEWDEEEEEEEEEVEEEEPKEEMEARQMEMEDDEAQEMQENWRNIDEEWEALEEWVEEKEEEE